MTPAGSDARQLVVLVASTFDAPSGSPLRRPVPRGVERELVRFWSNAVPRPEGIDRYGAMPLAEFRSMCECTVRHAFDGLAKAVVNEALQPSAGPVQRLLLNADIRMPRRG